MLDYHRAVIFNKMLSLKHFYFPCDYITNPGAYSSCLQLRVW